MRVLPAALRGNGSDGALKYLEERLLNALARNVAGDGGVFGFACDLVDLVDVDDALLGALHVVIRGLQELQKDVLNVLADVARLCKAGGVRNGKGDLKYPRKRFRKQGLAAARRSEHNDIAL